MFVSTSIQDKVNEIMSRNKSIYAGWSMTLGDPPPSEPAAPASVTGQGETVFSKADLEAAIEKARKQEKDKLYDKINGLESRLSEWDQREQARLAAEEEARNNAAAQQRAAEEENLSAKELLARKEQEWKEQFTSLNQTWEQRIQQMQQEQAQKEALLEKEREFATLQAYTQRRLAEEADNIAPQLVDFVNGRNVEEIEASIATIKAKSAEIGAMVQSVVGQAQPQPRGTAVTGFGPVGPTEFQAGTESYSIDDIKNMDMNQFAQLRSKLGLGGSANNRGMFG